MNPSTPGLKSTTEPLGLFAQVQPGLEAPLAAELRDLGFDAVEAVPGGATFAGGWTEAMRANLWSRGAGRILVRIASFRAPHLAQLDKRARRVDWSCLATGVPVRVEASCRKSRIYHDGAAAQRVAGALEAAGVPVAEDAGLAVAVRIEDDLCTVSVDTSGAPLHKRGHKEAVGKAPMRETMAAMVLRACGYDGSEPVLDPMCGSGTFVIEAAEIACGLAPGRSRGFAFERLAAFDADAWAAMRAAGGGDGAPALRFTGSDRDAGAFARARDNAARAGVAELCSFEKRAVSEIAPPEGPPGLVVVNPPYGGRIGGKARGGRTLHPLYGALGSALSERFRGWRVGLVTTDPGLVKTAGLPWREPGPPIAHGGLKVRLWQTGPLA